MIGVGKQPYASHAEMVTDGINQTLGGYKWLDGTVARTFTVVTTNANTMTAELHDRMPIILEPQDWPTWLGKVEGESATLLKPAGDDGDERWDYPLPP